MDPPADQPSSHACRLSSVSAACPSPHIHLPYLSIRLSTLAAIDRWVSVASKHLGACASGVSLSRSLSQAPRQVVHRWRQGHARSLPAARRLCLPACTSVCLSVCPSVCLRLAWVGPWSLRAAHRFVTVPVCGCQCITNETAFAGIRTPSNYSTPWTAVGGRWKPGTERASPWTVAAA